MFYAEIPFLNHLFSNFASTFLLQKKKPTLTPETSGLPGVGTFYFCLFVLCFGCLGSEVT